MATRTVTTTTLGTSTLDIAKGATLTTTLKAPDVVKATGPATSKVPVPVTASIQSVSKTQPATSTQNTVAAGQNDFSATGQNGFIPAVSSGFEPPISNGFTSPAQSGFTSPGHNGFAPGNGGFVPGQTGFHPGQHGFTSPGQNGFTPGQGGFVQGGFIDQSLNPAKPIPAPKPHLMMRLVHNLKEVFLKKPDSFLLHLNKLFGSTENLTAVISTIYYVLKLFGYYRKPKAVSNMENMPTFTTFDVARAAVEPKQMPSNWIGGSGSLLWNTRMTLRFFRLLPIYARARQLWSAPKAEEDTVLFATSIVQCGLDGVSQLLENVAFLTERHIAPPGFTDALTRVSQDRSKALYTLAYRMWFLAATCEVIRVIRKVHLMWHSAGEHSRSEKTDVTKQPAKKHPWWHAEFLLPMAWFPIGWQISGWAEEGSPGLNTALHSAACMLGDVHQTGILWSSSDKVPVAK